MQIDQILENNRLQTFFQPIISLDMGTVKGYEALARGPEGTLHTPLALFSEAHRYGRLTELDGLCYQNAIRRASGKQMAGLLFINFSPASVLSAQDDAFKLLSLYGGEFSEERIVLEFTMDGDVCKSNLFIDAVAQIREKGYHIACDNLLPHSVEFLSVHNMHPEYIKIDLSETGDTEMALYRDACTFAALSHAQIVVVGVRTAQQLEGLADSGIAYAQGDFFAAPSIELSVPQEPVRVLLANIAAARA